MTSGVPATDDVARNAAFATPPVATGGIRRHTAIYFAGLMLARAAGFLMLPFYTHYLRPADYGVVQLLEMTMDVVAIMAGSRIVAGIHRLYFRTDEERARRAVLSTALTLLAVSFILFGLLTFALAEPLTRAVLGTAENVHLVRLAAGSFALQALIVVPLGILQLWKKSAHVTAVTSAKLAIQLSLNIILIAGFGLGVTGMFLSTLVANVLIAVYLGLAVARPIGLSIDRKVAAALVRYGAPLMATQAATFFVAYGDRYFLRVSADMTQVGLYGLAYQFGFVVVTVGYLPFAMIWEPTRFQMAERSDRDAVYSRAFLFMNLVLLTGAVLCALFVRDFIAVMSSRAYHTAYLVVPVVLLAYVLQSWADFHEVGILVKGRTEFVTLANWIAAGVCLVGYAILIPRWLAWGAAITTCAALTVRWIFVYVLAQRMLPVHYEWERPLRLAGIAVAVVLVSLALPHPSVLASVMMRIALLGAYVTAVWFSGVLSFEDRRQIRSFITAPGAPMRQLLNR